jgi:hypothetical protein
MYRAAGAPVVLVSIQVSVLGLYLPPLLRKMVLSPPHTIISVPVHTAVCPTRAAGALVVVMAVQLSVVGLYLAFTKPLPFPPQTIISLPVHTAV